MSQESRNYSISRYLITGILTIIPIWLTWAVFYFLFTQLSRIGTPAVQALEKIFPDSIPWQQLGPWFTSILAVILTLVALYLLGWITTLVIGRRILSIFDKFMNHVPFVQTIYGSTKKLLSVLQTEPNDVQRVVLIEFPSSQMKTVGFVTQILTDGDTKQKLAAVYVPTTPNPTSGYLEIVPLEKVVSTDWTMDEAMTFIISGGAVAPSRLNYTRGVSNID